MPFRGVYKKDSSGLHVRVRHCIHRHSISKCQCRTEYADQKDSLGPVFAEVENLPEYLNMDWGCQEKVGGASVTSRPTKQKQILTLEQCETKLVDKACERACKIYPTRIDCVTLRGIRIPVGCCVATTQTPERARFWQKCPFGRTIALLKIMHLNPRLCLQFSTRQPLAEVVLSALTLARTRLRVCPYA